MKAKIIMGVVIFLIVITGFFVVTDMAVKAEDADSELKISKKLDDILKNQKAILDGIASIREELNVIKIRVTR